MSDAIKSSAQVQPNLVLRNCLLYPQFTSHIALPMIPPKG